MGVWSRELARRVSEWQVSRGPERTTDFLYNFFTLRSSHLEKHRCFLDIPVILVLVSLVFVFICGQRKRGGGKERGRELYVHI